MQSQVIREHALYHEDQVMSTCVAMDCPDDDSFANFASLASLASASVSRRRPVAAASLLRRIRLRMNSLADATARAALTLAFVWGLGSGCASGAPPGSPVAGAAMVGDAGRPAVAAWLRTELYFAVGRADAPRSVDGDAWRAFLDQEVTPRFPDGFTVFDGYGQWRSRSGEEGSARIGRLHTKIMVILHPDDADARMRVDAVRLAFKARTGQDSVLRATAPAEVSF